VEVVGDGDTRGVEWWVELIDSILEIEGIPAIQK
jgi:hypothetical protein